MRDFDPSESKMAAKPVASQLWGRGTLYPLVQDLYPLYRHPGQRCGLCQNFKQTTLTTRLYKVRTNLYPPLTKTFRRAWPKLLYPVFTARCYASAVLAMGLCPSVCLCPSVASQCSTKTAKHSITETTPHDTPGNLVF